MLNSATAKQQAQQQIVEQAQQRSSFPYKPFKIQKQHVNFQQQASNNLVSQSTQTQAPNVGVGAACRQPSNV